MIAKTNMKTEDILEIVEYNVLMTSLNRTNFDTECLITERYVKSCNFIKSLNCEIIKYIDLLTEWNMNNKNTYKIMHMRSFGHDP